MDKFKKGDLITNSSGSFAKVLRVGTTVLATKWFESPKDAMGATDGSVCFNDRAVRVLGIRTVSKKDEEIATTKKPAMVEHIVTEQDLEMNPDWADNGVVVGESISYQENPTDEDLANAVKAVKSKKGKK